MSPEQVGQAPGVVKSLSGRVESAVFCGIRRFKERSLCFVMCVCVRHSVVVFSRYLEALVKKYQAAS